MYWEHNYRDRKNLANLGVGVLTGDKPLLHDRALRALVDYQTLGVCVDPAKYQLGYWAGRVGLVVSTPKFRGPYDRNLVGVCVLRRPLYRHLAFPA